MYQVLCPSFNLEAVVQLAAEHIVADTMTHTSRLPANISFSGAYMVLLTHQREGKQLLMTRDYHCNVADTVACQ